jgi:hypothetical protein
MPQDRTHLGLVYKLGHQKSRSRIGGRGSELITWFQLQDARENGPSFSFFFFFEKKNLLGVLLPASFC